MNPSLTILILIPIIGALLIPLCPPRASRGIALVLGWFMLGVSAYVGLNFLPGHGMQFEHSVAWFRQPFPVTWHVGVDGMSVALIMLTTIVTLTALYASKFTSTTRDTEEPRPQLYYSMVMLLTASIIGTFVSLDLLQFFVFWELELAPMYFLIAIWGGKNRSYAAMKFLLYTFFGGIFMLAGLLYLYFQLGANGIGATFDIMQLQTLAPALPHAIQAAAALGFGLAFLIKLPSFPFHTWLPDAHVEAPTPISMILAGLLLKMGSYGLVRIVLGFFPDVVAEYGPWLIALGAFNVVWAAMACLVQQDMKRVIAFSSVSHMGFVLMGVAALSAGALNGAIFQMVAHGFISAALFFLVGVVYDRVHTRDIPEIGGGLAKQMPETFYFWLLAALANLGLPALAGFVAEVTVFYGTYTSPVANAFPWVRGWVIFAGLGVILSAGYMLYLVRRLFYGDENPRWGDHLVDMMPHERFVGSVLGFFIIALGCYPLMLTRFYEDVADNMAKQAATHVSSSPNNLNGGPTM
jgi:proton-translocating NADH-quinone oxidoreductase chain M